MAPRNKIKVAVLCGGLSSEREVSLMSGRQVFNALSEKKYKRSLIEITKDGRWLLKNKLLSLFDKNKGFLKSDLKKFGVIFIVLHGKFGEDGKVQALLDMIGVPYTGSGMLASAFGMDKTKTLEVVEKNGVRVPKFLSFSFKDKKDHTTKVVTKEIGYPCVVKPNDSGLSIGVTIVQEKQQLLRALKKSFEESEKIIVEKYIKGRELTCGVMGNSGKTKITVLPPVEIIPDGSFFDYEAKYFSKKTQEICPARISREKTEEIQELAKRVHLLLGCDGLTRSDFILSPTGQLHFLEINTIPGLTEASLCPQEARAAGMSFSEFLDKQIELALNEFIP